MVAPMVLMPSGPMRGPVALAARSDQHRPGVILVRSVPFVLGFTGVFVLLCLYEFILFWIDGIVGRNVPLAERWVPPFTGTLVWLAIVHIFDRGQREARSRL